jgi:FkbM family methyltransferase
MISLQQAHKLFLKTPEERQVTARFYATKWLAKLTFAPHKVRLRVTHAAEVRFWWSCFPQGVPPEADSILSYWGEDAGDLRLLWKILQPGMTFFDVGAYHGIYTVLGAKKVGETGFVAAFEPSRREQRRLALHLRLNGLSSVDLVPCAVGAEEGDVTFVRVLSGNTTRNGLRAPLCTDPVETVIVHKKTIDNYLKQTGTTAVDLVKIDTEGAELEVFQGAQRLLGQLRPLIICEVLDSATRPWGYLARDIVSRLQSRSYRWFDIQHDGNLLPHGLREGYPEVRNYLAVPEEKLGRVREFMG